MATQKLTFQAEQQPDLSQKLIMIQDHCGTGINYPISVT
jgi:hypothetical protein